MTATIFTLTHYEQLLQLGNDGYPCALRAAIVIDEYEKYTCALESILLFLLPDRSEGQRIIDRLREVYALDVAMPDITANQIGNKESKNDQ